MWNLWIPNFLLLFGMHDFIILYYKFHHLNNTVENVSTLCFFFFQAPSNRYYSYTLAAQYCESFHANLANITTQEEAENIASQPYYRGRIC